MLRGITTARSVALTVVIFQCHFWTAAAFIIHNHLTVASACITFAAVSGQLFVFEARLVLLRAAKEAGPRCPGLGHFG